MEQATTETSPVTVEAKEVEKAIGLLKKASSWSVWDDTISVEVERGEDGLELVLSARGSMTELVYRTPVLGTEEIEETSYSARQLKLAVGKNGVFSLSQKTEHYPPSPLLNNLQGPPDPPRDEPGALVVTDTDEITVEVQPETYHPIPDGEFGVDFTTELEEVDGVALLQNLLFIEKAISPDEGRPHLNGFLVRHDGTLVSTDGHRLHVVEQGDLHLPPAVTVPGGGHIPGTEEGMLIPLEGTRILIDILKFEGKSLGTVHVTWATNGVGFLVGRWELVVKRTEARFPPYKKVIPREWHTAPKAILEAKRAKKGLDKTIKLLSGAGVALSFNGQSVVMRAEHFDAKVNVKIPAIVTKSIDFEFGLNPKYLVEAIETGTNDQFVLYVAGKETDAMVFTNGTGYGIIMPMRL